MLFDIWKVFNPLQGGGFNPFQQSDKNGFDPSNVLGKSGLGLPFDPKMLGNSEWVNDYVQNIIKESMPNQMAPHQADQDSSNPVEDSKTIKYDLFEMHDYIIVRIYLTEDVNEESISISLGHSRIIMKGHPQQDPFIVSLPEHPSDKRFGATCKDGVIEMRLRKRKNEPVKPITIRFD
ncbi:hypothetical protein [Alteribacter populi]|uniref:hypothetical protein n=1 Tax=Alteribacter populi TaxID=2011011 RepID=UPI000BBB4A3D|nr:hypothetical protein [Alteribacter populi]